jgi:hypothetical protein
MPNFFNENPKASNFDNLIRFVLRARKNTRWTSAKKALIFQERRAQYQLNMPQQEILQHTPFLNNCTYNLKETTVRNDTVQRI